MHALCPSHRQSRRQQTKYDCMSVTLTSDHSKIFFAAVTAAFAAPPPGRTATAAAAALRPLPPALRAAAVAALPHAAAALPQCHSRTASLSSATRRRLAVSVWHAVCRRGSTAAALRLPVPASLRRCTAAALPPQSPHRVRTDSAVPPLPRHPVCRRAALPRVPAVPPHCGALES